MSRSVAARTGELFPGRPLVRPRVKFCNALGTDEWSDECEKKYRHGASHSPGLFTLQCACSHPKLIGVSVMLRAESVATALNTLVSRFTTLPHVLFYDNACNLARSVGLRFPWISEKCTILCDRFHYRTHKCGPEFDPDSYTMCNSLLTSGAEALNRQWAASRNNIRYLSGDNLVPFLYARSVFINLRAHLRDRENVVDVEDENIIELALNLIPCSCSKCLIMKEQGKREQNHE